MVTVNKRTGIPEAVTINAVTAGGSMQIRIEQGYDGIYRSDPDGLEVPMLDREIQFCRGRVVSQDWAQAIALLEGTLGTLVFYERKSGVAAATGYVQHTITNPVIHRIAFSFRKGGYAPVTYDFECLAADETKGFADMWVPLDDQAAPTYVAAARGGYRIASASHGGSIDILHVMGFDFALALQLVKECNDSDVGYTSVDARLDGLRANGSISYQDSTISAATMVGQKLLAAARGDLVLSAVQGAGGAAKTITIGGVVFNTGPRTANSSKPPFTEEAMDFEVGNDTTTQLTLSGANKIIAIV